MVRTPSTMPALGTSAPDFRLADYLFPLKPREHDHYFEGLRRAGFV